MKLSVIIPVYNAEKYLSQCLDSVLSQDLTDLEVICVDDASTDSSADIVSEYEKRDSRVRLIRNNENLYAGKCRNRGLEAAQGEYVHFLDADDLVEEGAYSIFYEAAVKNNADFVKGCANSFDNDTGDISTTPLLSLTKLSDEDFGHVMTFLDKPEIFSQISVVPWNGIYKREFLMSGNIRFNSLICVNDRSFFNEVCLAARRILIIRDLLVRYRVNNGASLMGNRARNFSCEFSSYEIVKKQCEKYQPGRDAERIILNRELVDIFIWYRRYKKLPEIQDNIISQTTEFSRNLDISILENYPPDFRWYYDYLLLLEKEILTVAVYLKGSKAVLDACLGSIGKQNTERFIVYGISPNGDETGIFGKYAAEDKRFVKVVSELGEIPRETPYFFETHPKEYKTDQVFRKRIKKLMEESENFLPKEDILYKPKEQKTEKPQAQEQKKQSLFGKILKKLTGN